MRYDEVVLGTRFPEYDVVCPFCLSAVGFPCTKPVRDGHNQLKEVHEERRDALSRMAEGELDRNASAR